MKSDPPSNPAACNRYGTQVLNLERPILHLDGRVLRNAFDSLVEAADKLEGVESLIESLSVKSTFFSRTFAMPNRLTQPELLDICAFAPTVRRRIKLAMRQQGFEHLKGAICDLLDNLRVDNADRKIRQTINMFPTTKEYRWVRDLAAEIIHFREPDTYPLMTRWMWDRMSNTGVLREIWFADYRDNHLDIDDTIPTHFALREELSSFLRSDGVYANMPFMIDLLCAWIYGDYIGSQGGSFLKVDFTQSGKNISYVLRMLGLDGASAKDGTTRVIMPDGNRYVLSNVVDASTH